jgi:ATP-dependent DNA helicase RecG
VIRGSALGSGSYLKKASLEDIEEEKVRWFVKEAKKQRGLDIPEDLPLEEVLMRLKLTGNKKLTNAAILLFCKNPQKFFTRPEVK